MSLWFIGGLAKKTIPTGIDLFKNNILQRLQDQLIQQWDSDIDNSPKSINFRIFNLNFEREKISNQSTTSTMDFVL